QHCCSPVSGNASKDDGLVAVSDDAVLAVPPLGTRQRDAFDVGAEALQILDGVAAVPALRCALLALWHSTGRRIREIQNVDIPAYWACRVRLDAVFAGVDVRLLASMGLSSGVLCPFHVDPRHLPDR